LLVAEDAADRTSRRHICAVPGPVAGGNRPQWPGRSPGLHLSGQLVLRPVEPLPAGRALAVAVRVGVGRVAPDGLGLLVAADLRTPDEAVPAQDREAHSAL